MEDLNSEWLAAADDAQLAERRSRLVNDAGEMLERNTRDERRAGDPRSPQQIRSWLGHALGLIDAELAYRHPSRNAARTIDDFERLLLVSVRSLGVATAADVLADLRERPALPNVFYSGVTVEAVLFALATDKLVADLDGGMAFRPGTETSIAVRRWALTGKGAAAIEPSS